MHHLTTPIIQRSNQLSQKGKIGVIENLSALLSSISRLLIRLVRNLFSAITTHLSKRQNIRATLEGIVFAGTIMLLFALYGVWILHYRNISLTAFRLAGGIILLLLALDMLVNKRQARREHGNDTLSTDDNIAIFSFATPRLAGPAAITSVMVVATAIVLITNSLRQRLRLTAIIQTCSSLAFISNLSAMISLYFGIGSLGSWLFVLSIILMVAAMIQFTIKIQISNSALDVHLSNLGKHQEWQDYLATSKLRGKRSRKAAPPPPPHPAG